MSETTTDVQQDAVPAQTQAPEEKLVPVGEAIRYRKRAQAAEMSLTELQATIDEMRAELDDANQTVGRLERRQRIDGLLRDSEAIDVEAARLLTEVAVASMDEPDLCAAVEDLRRARPYLFRRRGAGAASAMPAHRDEHGPTHEAAEHAAASGHRRDLLRYLRLRRGA